MGICKMMNINLQKLLKSIRLKKGLSQPQLSRKIDLSIMAISEIERGKRKPSCDTLLKWLDEGGYVIVPRNQTSTEQKSISKETLSVPLLPAFPAGDPKLVDNNHKVEYINLPIEFLKSRQKSKIRMFPIAGDSMSQKIPEGAFVIVEKHDGSRPLKKGTIGWFYIKSKNEHTVKEYQPGPRSSEVMLVPRSYNDSHVPIVCSKRDIVVEGIVFSYFMPHI